MKASEAKDGLNTKSPVHKSYDQAVGHSDKKHLSHKHAEEKYVARHVSYVACCTNFGSYCSGEKEEERKVSMLELVRSRHCTCIATVYLLPQSRLVVLSFA